MIYMDNAATSWPKPEAVNQAITCFMQQGVGNPGRSSHELSISSGRVIYEARAALAQLFGVVDPLRIVFTKNATESLNLVIRGMLRPGDHVVISSMEHNSVMRPLRALESKGITVTLVPCSPEGYLDPSQVDSSVQYKTRLIILTHASNVVGTFLPIAQVGHIARQRGVVFCVDAAQTAGACAIDVNDLNIDLLAFTGHKSLFGPQGTGGLYIRDGLEEVLCPLMEGGTGSRSEHEFQPDFLPDKYESGTPNTIGIVGLEAGVCFILSEGVYKIRAREEYLTRILIEELQRIDNVVVYGSRDVTKQTAVVSLNISNLSPSDVAMRLEDDYGVMCRVGLQCAPSAHRTIGTFPEGTVRISPGYYTTEEEIEHTIAAIRMIAHSAR